MAVALLLVDGLGLGSRDPQRNPLLRARLRWLSCLADPASGLDPEGPVLVPTDATLGVPGLPQSATGQTTILSGINAAAVLGRHLNGWCTRSLAALLDGQSLFSRARARGRRVAFANAYPPAFFAGRRRFPAVSTVATTQAGVRLRTLGDLRRGRALYQEFTNRQLIGRGYDLPVLSPREAGGRLAVLVRDYDLTAFEFFQTDLAGHAQDMHRAVALLEELDGLLGALLAGVDLGRTLVVLTSDHGNVEDLTTRRHTRNPVPTLLWGRGREEAAAAIRGLADLAPALLPWV